MREYIVLVAVSAILAAFTDVIAPKEWRGYIRVVTGFLILAVLITPLAKLKNIEIFHMEERFEVSDFKVKDRVAEGLEKNIENDIEQRAVSEFNVSIVADVELDLDEEKKIKGVKRITVKSKNIPDGLENRLKEVYGCENVEFRVE